MSAGTWQAARDAAEVERVLEGVLARSEFRESSGWLEQLLEQLFGSLGGGGELDLGVDPWLLLLALGLLSVLLATPLVRALRRARSESQAPAAPGSASSRGQKVGELRRAARAARGAGDQAAALRYLLFALVVGLGERGDLEYRDAWTKRELLERGQPRPPVRALLLPLVEELEAKEFGRIAVTPGDVERLAALCERWLGPEVAA